MRISTGRFNSAGRRHKMTRALICAAVAAAPLASMSQAMAGGGVFSTQTYSASGTLGQMSDSNIGVSSNYYYQADADINDSKGSSPVAVTPSTGSPVNFNAGGLTSGTNWSLGGDSGSYTTATSNVTGGIGTMLKDFTYGGTATFTLTNLIGGNTYDLTFYNQTFSAGDNRTQNITASDGGTGSYNEDPGATGDGNLLRYTFVATGTAGSTGNSEVLTVTPAGTNSMHFYAFSNQQIFTNTFNPTIGNSFNNAANWSNTAVPGLNQTVPGGVGSNAEFSAQTLPTTVTLDSSVTLGHIQFDGTASYTLAQGTGGANALIFQTDPGGISVMNSSTVGGVHTIAVPVTLNNAAALLGPGTLAFSNAITSNGFALTVNSGTLQFGDGVSANGTTDGPVVNNSIVNFATTGTQTFSSAISGTGTITTSGPGTLTLASAITGTENVTTGGVGNLTISGVLGGTGNLTTGGTGTVILSNSNTFTGTTTVGTNSPLQLNTTNALQYSVLNTNGGGHLIFNAGVTNFAVGALSGSQTLALTDSASAAINLSVGGSSTNGSYSGSLTGSGSLTKIGTGTQTLSGNSTYTGVTTFSAGIINVSSLNNYGSAGPLGNRASDASQNVGLHFTGGTLQYTGSTPTSTNRYIRMYVGNSATIDASGTVPTATMSFIGTGPGADEFDTGGTRSLTLTGTNTGNNFFDIQLIDQSTNPTSLIKTGAGTWVLGGSGSLASTYSGGTYIQQGTLAIDPASGSLPTSGIVTFGAGTTSGVLALGDTTNNVAVTQTVGGLTNGTGSSLANAVVGATTGMSTLTVNSAVSTAYVGALGGSGTNQNNFGFTKSGSAAFYLYTPSSTPSTYTGPTKVLAGTLGLGGAPTASSTVASYRFEGNSNDSSANGNNLTLANAPTYVAGIATGTQAINFNGNSQYGSIPYNSTLNVQGQYTVSFWEKLNAAATSGQTFISTRNGADVSNGGSVSAMDIQATPTGLHADFGGSFPGYGGDWWLTTAANATVSLGTSWNMVTYTINSAGWAIYVNGVLNTASGYGSTYGVPATNARNPILMGSSQTLSIGSQEGGGSSYTTTNSINGAMDEVNLFNVAMTPSQIAALYASQLGIVTNVLPASTPLQLASAGTLDLQGSSQTIGSINDTAVGQAGTITNTGLYASTLTDNITSGTATFSGAITNGSASLSFVKSGQGTQILAGNSTYTGTTTVSGGTLVINGSLPAGGTVMVAANATLGGSGTVGPLSAGTSTAGLIAPAFGGSPLILTSPTVSNPTGLNFGFQLTQLKPNYGTPTASGNDVLHLTGSTALASNLTSANTVSVYLPAGLASGQVYEGGFYADLDTSLTTEVAGAKYVFFEASSNSSAGDHVSFDNVNYQPIADFGLSAATSVTFDSATFPGNNSQFGAVTQFTISTAVPEPGALAMLGLGAAGLLARRRRVNQ